METVPVTNFYDLWISPMFLVSSSCHFSKSGTFYSTKSYIAKFFNYIDVIRHLLGLLKIV